ncbi:hypothetical protein BGX31_009280 [Mortierella sp. GBA43]|nr:hypothetical protein BGX31_009280 [Mortierella sp. GBA43]
MVKLSISIAAMAAVVASVGAAPMSVFSTPERFEGCVPGVFVKEYHPFYLESVKLGSLVSKKAEELLVVGGVPGNKDFEQLELCVVSSDYGCDRNIPSNCIYPDVEYRFRVNGPVRGYLKINDNKELEIVENYGDASGLNLYREEGWGLRVAHRQEDGSRAVFSTNGGGRAITLVEQVKNDAAQWFEIRADDAKNVAKQWRNTVENHEDVEEQAGCLDSLRIYQTFKLKSLDVNAYINKHPLTSLVLSGGNEPLAICAAFGDFPCSLRPPRFCVREFTEYYIRAELEGGAHGYLSTRASFVRVVDDIGDANKFYFFNEDGQVKVGYHHEEKGDLVFTATEFGRPVRLEEPTKTSSQAFGVEIVKAL